MIIIKNTLAVRATAITTYVSAQFIDLLIGRVA